MPSKSVRLVSLLKRPVSIAALLVTAAALLMFAAPEEKRISIYSSAANYSLPVLPRNGQEYVGLLEMVEPLGTVNAKADGQKWKFRYNKIEGEFTAGSKRARVAGHEIDLPGTFLFENGRGLVPLASLSVLLPRFLGGPVSFHEQSRRLFIGNVAVHFTAEVKGAPAALVMNFSAPVNPRIATEPGKLKMVFTHEPLVAPGTQRLTFNSSAISSANFDEENGAAELTVNATVPLFAKFSNDGRTITIEPAPQSAAQTQAPPAAPPASAALPVSPVPSVPASPPRYFAVIDASHGGSETGAALSDRLAEKDVTLAFARQLRHELESRGLTTLLVRDGDTTISLDQRASVANAAHAAIYIALHASSDGNGIRLFTAIVPNVAESRGPFLTWDTAQSPFRSSSQSAASALAMLLTGTQLPVRSLVAPLRPLENIIAPAIGVEVAPGAADVSELSSSAYQQAICSSLAAGLASMRGRLEAGR